MKGYVWLGLSIVFFISAVTTISYTRSDVDATSGCSQPMPLYSLGGLVLVVLFFGLGFMCFTNYFFGYKTAIHIIGVIPERMASSRFPGKPLAKINGIPMVEHVWRNAKKCKSLEEVYVCSPDTEIIDYVTSICGKAILTKTFNRASDQVAYAVERLEFWKHKYDIIVMIQGDEPLVTPEMIDEALQPLIKGEATVSNLMAPIQTKKDELDKNTIKVVTDLKGDALYFSRQSIPSGLALGFKQVCIIPFTREALFKFQTLPPTTYEQSESVDMMRLVENGIKVKMVKTATETHSVDVPKDIKVVERMMKCKQS